DQMANWRTPIASTRTGFPEIPDVRDLSESADRRSRRPRGRDSRACNYACAMEVTGPVDLEMLRRERLRRLQDAMRAFDMQACLLFNEPNVRYATGVTAMPVYAMSTFARCAVVPQEGTPILFEHPNSVHRSRQRAPDVRPMHAWEFFDDPGAEARVWAGEAVAALRELGVS